VTGLTGAKSRRETPRGRFLGRGPARAAALAALQKRRELPFSLAAPSGSDWILYTHVSRQAPIDSPPDPEISYQLYKNSKRHGGICHFSDRFDGSKKPARGLHGAVFTPRAGPRLRPRRAEKTAGVSSFPGAPVKLRLDPTVPCLLSISD